MRAVIKGIGNLVFGSGASAPADDGVDAAPASPASSDLNKSPQQARSPPSSSSVKSPLPLGSTPIKDAGAASRLEEARQAWSKEQQRNYHVASPKSGQKEETVGEAVASATGSLFVVSGSGELDKKGSDLTIYVLQLAPYKYRFLLQNEARQQVVLSQPLSNDLQFQYSKRDRSITWILAIPRGGVQSFSFVFDDAEEEKQFKTELSIALLQTQRKQDFAKIVAEADKSWVLDAYEAGDDVKEEEKEAAKYDFSEQPVRDTGDFMSDEDEEDHKSEEDEDDEDERPSSSAFKTPERKRGGARSDDEDESESKRSVYQSAKKTTERFQTPLTGRRGDDEKNTGLNVGMSVNRSYVVRGHKVGVFKHDEDGNMKYINKIPEVKTLKGDIFTPQKTMLTQQDNRMLLLNPNESSTVYCMDLERGQIIEEWQSKKDGVDIAVRQFGPTEKYAERTGNEMIAAVNSNALFSLDPRQRNPIAQMQSYTKDPGLNCVATTGEGHIVAGSDQGEIRLFTKIGQRAKTSLPGLGDAMVGIDVTEDGQWILGTCRSYLLVIPTNVEAKHKTGFQIGMGAEKPRPIKLVLSKSDIVKYGIKSVNFTAAKFNTGENITEEWIVTSTGPYIITWNFRAVKRGITTDYKIKTTSSNVVADQFRFNMSSEVVVATPNNVFLEKRALIKRVGKNM